MEKKSNSDKPSSQIIVEDKTLLNIYLYLDNELKLHLIGKIVNNKMEN